MGTTLHTPHPWPHITAALRGRGPRSVAIAYLDATAPELLPLRAGDLLIVNAARAAVRAHATSPTALARFLDRGVRVLSTPNLHTGLIVTPRCVIVGPSSASHASTVADEAALVTDDPAALAAAHVALAGLGDTTDVDQAFLDNATAVWAVGRTVPLAGIGSRTRAEHDFLPTPVRRMFVRRITDYTPSADEQRMWEERTDRRAAAGPDAQYRAQWLRVDTPDTGRRTRLERFDVLFEVTADTAWIHPPAVVDTGPVPIPHARHAVAYLLRTRTDLEPLSVPVAARALADAGHPNPRLHLDHRVVSPALRTALLQLWNL
ncbi:MAG: phosphatidylserine/phosphatidylglycerophosphate/cardiolipin synthase family protein [Rhodococcus sp. (in: high G+C Gram-positive bacteria)]|uniref:phosphatidylserine/phosphatidylglycerophosphate/ cardiolipin synthase family protein n=1 Tax=Rhodococcus sp. TaxID=1831 RepID=UPI003BB7E081